MLGNMAHVTITVLNEKGEGVPFVRSMDYGSKADVCADVENIMKFITDLVE